MQSLEALVVLSLAQILAKLASRKYFCQVRPPEGTGAFQVQSVFLKCHIYM